MRALTIKTLELPLTRPFVIACGARLLKIKLNRQQILEKVAVIRTSRPCATLIIDTNEVWADVDLKNLFAALQTYGSTMTEQPLTAG